MVRDRMFGLGEPLAWEALSGKNDADEMLRRVEKLGCTAFREWMHLPVVLDAPSKVNPEALKVFTYVLNRYREMDIEITGMSHNWFLAGDMPINNRNAMYPRDLTEGSLYMQTLHVLEESWRTMVATFPQVEQWEVGNEWNTDTFLHPVGWQVGTPGFSEDEKMDIAMDLMYFSARGIRRGNPKAKVVSFSPAVAQPNLGSRSAVFCPPGYGIAKAFSMIYERIESRKFWGSTSSDDFFDLLAWHPYLLTHMMPMAASEQYPAERRFFRMEDIDAQWRSVNDMVYTIMSMHGDGHKKVLLTELGFSDWGIPGLEEKQIDMTTRMFDYIRTMPYVKTIHYFRLNAPSPEEVDSDHFHPVGEECFGLFRKINGKYQPRPKAYGLQKVYGGKGNLAVNH